MSFIMIQSQTIKVFYNLYLELLVGVSSVFFMMFPSSSSLSTTSCCNLSSPLLTRCSLGAIGL